MLIPILRIEYVATNELLVSGVFYYRDLQRAIVVDPTGITSTFLIRDYSSKEFLDHYYEQGRKLPRLFKYTGKDWFGKFTTVHKKIVSQGWIFKEEKRSAIL